MNFVLIRWESALKFTKKGKQETMPLHNNLKERHGMASSGQLDYFGNETKVNVTVLGLATANGI